MDDVKGRCGGALMRAATTMRRMGRIVQSVCSAPQAAVWGALCAHNAHYAPTLCRPPLTVSLFSFQEANCSAYTVPSAVQGRGACKCGQCRCMHFMHNGHVAQGEHRSPAAALSRVLP